MATDTINLREDTYLPLASKASAAGPVVRNVKVLGIKSRNGREYPLNVMAKARDLYEGKPVNLDHPKPNQEMREFTERFGRITNVRMGKDGLYADMTYNPAHPLAKAFDWWVKNDPNAVGLSHNATARIQRNREGKDEVTEIIEVESVDLVADPATTKGLLESLQHVTERNCDMYGEDKDDKKVDGKNVLEEGPEGMADMLGDNEPKADSAPAGDDWSQHLGQMILGILGDKGMDHGAKKAKILQALKLVEDEPEATPEAEEDPSIYDSDDESAQADDMGSASDEVADDEAEETSEEAPADDDEAMAKKAEEALRKTGDKHYLALLRQLDAFRVAEARRRTFSAAKGACEKAGLPAYAVTETFLSTLAHAPRGEWERVLEDRRRVTTKFSKPKSAPASVADGLEALRKALREEI
jgi:hypothetical protein